MKSTPFLRKQISLLLESFGEDAVLSVIREYASIDSEILTGKSLRKSPVRSRKIIPSSEIIERYASEHPERANAIRSVGRLFIDRILLPTMNDVNRFLNKNVDGSVKIESRAKALPRILSVVVEMDRAEVQRLLEGTSYTSPSSFSLISDAILSRD